MVASDREKWSPPTAKTYLFLRGFALRPARVMFARHLIGLSSCLQKSPPQLCHHLFRITRVLVCCRRHFPGRGCFSSCEASRARADFERSSRRSSSAAHIRHPPCILPEFSGVFRTGLTCFIYQLITAFAIPLQYVSLRSGLRNLHHNDDPPLSSRPSVVPLATLPRPIFLFWFLRTSSLSTPLLTCRRAEPKGRKLLPKRKLLHHFQ